MFPIPANTPAVILLALADLAIWTHVLMLAGGAK